jgi:hypothetical protein
MLPPTLHARGMKIEMWKIYKWQEIWRMTSSYKHSAWFLINHNFNKFSLVFLLKFSMHLFGENKKEEEGYSCRCFIELVTKWYFQFVLTFNIVVRSVVHSPTKHIPHLIFYFILFFKKTSLWCPFPNKNIKKNGGHRHSKLRILIYGTFNSYLLSTLLFVLLSIVLPNTFHIWGGNDSLAFK